jgi:hypothetical protein
MPAISRASAGLHFAALHCDRPMAMMYAQEIDVSSSRQVCA